MRTDQEIAELMQRIQDENGCIVLGFPNARPIGEVIPHVQNRTRKILTPGKIVGLASHEDYTAQARKYGLDDHGNEATYYYKVIAE